MKARRAAPLALACLGLALGGGASAEPPLLLGPPATAQSLAVEILAPDQTIPATTLQIVAPPATMLPRAPFVYPDDGSIVSAASVSESVSASATDGTAAAVSDLTGLSLFGGEITAEEVRASASSAGTIGDISDSHITRLVVLGRPVADPAANQEIPLADWGSLLVLGQTTKHGRVGAASWRGTITALVVRLDADHGGLAAGTRIRIGFADAYSRLPAPPVTRTATTAMPGTAPTPATHPTPPTPPTITMPASTPTLPGGATNPSTRGPARPLPRGVGVPGVSIAKQAAAPKPAQMPPTTTKAVPTTKKTTAKKTKTKAKGPLPVLARIPNVTPKLTAGGYVFPVYGPSGYGDSFGAVRADVSGGWHHGDDIFAPLGAPILAVAEGTVFAVGWNDVGGWRLWLRDQAGNEFYYAHLSAYTTLAAVGRHVKAGDVLGFVGNTGDAQGTPFHLHFEIHPVSLLFLGYEGAVDPTTYLDAWKRLEDVRILPAVPFATAGAHGSSVPTPGAILLDSTDISTANGLDPGSLRRAMRRPPAPVREIAPPIAELPVPLPVLDRA